MTAQIARAGQRPPIEAHPGVINGMCNPNTLAPVDLHMGPRKRSRDDDVGTFPTDGGGLAKNAISHRLTNTYLCVRARTRQRRIGHILACGRSVLELMPLSESDGIRAGDSDRLRVLAGCH